MAPSGTPIAVHERHHAEEVRTFLPDAQVRSYGSRYMPMHVDHDLCVQNYVLRREYKDSIVVLSTQGAPCCFPHRTVIQYQIVREAVPQMRRSLSPFLRHGTSCAPTLSRTVIYHTNPSPIEIFILGNHKYDNLVSY